MSHTDNTSDQDCINRIAHLFWDQDETNHCNDPDIRGYKRIEWRDADPDARKEYLNKAKPVFEEIRNILLPQPLPDDWIKRVRETESVYKHG